MKKLANNSDVGMYAVVTYISKNYKDIKNSANEKKNTSQKHSRIKNSSY